MEGKIKMPEALARELCENETEMKLFDSLSYEGKKEYIRKSSAREGFLRVQLNLFQ